jgi:hypothetical protein
MHVVKATILMRNVFWLRERIIAGRSGPNRAAWSPAELAAGGIGAVLSVNDGELVHCDDLSAVGINYSCVPLSDSAPPQPEDLQVCSAALPKALKFAMSSCRLVALYSSIHAVQVAQASESGVDRAARLEVDKTVEAELKELAFFCR